MPNETQNLVDLVDMDDPEFIKMLSSFAAVQSIGVVSFGIEAIKGHVMMAYALGRLRERRGKAESMTFIVGKNGEA